MSGADIIAIIILLAIVVAVVVYLLHWLYRHSSKDLSFVRTGWGGEKIVMGGGALVLPIVHDVTDVSMNTLRIEVRRAGEKSLITRNRMRIEVTMEFFVRVVPTPAAVAAAARTLGSRTMDPESLRDLVQGRFVDAMGAVAARMTMEEVHERRSDYTAGVRELVAGTLTDNGLELETASLTNVDQADMKLFNPSNAFDAEGLTRLTEEIETRKKKRNDIEQDTMIAIRAKNLESEKLALSIEQESEYARLAQEREVAVRRAQQRAEIAREKSDREREIEEVQIRSAEEIEKSRLKRDLAIEVERIHLQQETERLDVQRRRALEIEEQERLIAVAEKSAEQSQAQSAAERVRIQESTSVESERVRREQEVEGERIRHQQETERLEIVRRRMLELEEQDRVIALAAKSAEQSQAQSAAEIVRIREASEVDAERIRREHEVETGRVRGAQEVAAERIRRQQDTEQLDIQRRRALEIEEQERMIAVAAKSSEQSLAESTAARQRIQHGLEVDAERVHRDEEIEKLEVGRRRAVELEEQDRIIAVAEKSKLQSEAQVAAEKARAEAVTAQEAVVSAREQEIAERLKRIELVEAARRAESEALKLTTLATAELSVAESRAKAQVTGAEAAKVRYAVDAEGRRGLNDAENMRSEASRQSALQEELVQNLPAIIRESVKPMERIESIKILQVDGLPGFSGNGGGGGNGGGEGGGSSGGGGGSLADQAVNSALRYRTQVPFVDGLLREIGMASNGVTQLGGLTVFPVGEEPGDPKASGTSAGKGKGKP
jgi:uncharacterized membrane protein YqiK